MISVEVLPVTGLPEIAPGDDLAGLITAHAALRDGDVVVVAQKVVSKVEDAHAALHPGEDPVSGRRRIAREQAVRVVADTPQVLIVETRHGLVCANAGVDASNVPDDRLTLLPADPDASAVALREGLQRTAGVDVAVVIADTFGRPWRVGQTDVAIGVAGMGALRDERGGTDRQGRELDVTEVAIADEVAAAADLVRRKADGVPVVIVRGLRLPPDEGAGAAVLVRAADADLFRRGAGMLGAALAAASAGTGTPPPRPVLEDCVAQVRGLVRGATLEIGGDGRITVRPGSAGGAVDVGAAAMALVALLVDRGHGAWWAPGGEGAVVHPATEIPEDGR